jgi:hypothetical protein
VAIMLPAALLLQFARVTPEQRQRRLIEAMVYVGIAAFVSFWIFRIFQPYAFSGPGFFGIKPNPHWIATIQELRNQSAGDVDFPPAWQWARRPVWFSGKNLTLWGLGLPLGLLAWAGFIWVGWRILKGDWQKHSLLWGWTAFYFSWQSLQFNPTMRYQLPVYPILAIFAGWAVVELYDRGRAMVARSQVWAVGSRLLSILIGGVVIFGTLAWAYAFSRIYVEPFSRIAASRWILQNVPGPLNLNIQTEQGEYNQPISYPYDYVMYPGQVWETVFTANASGAVSQAYLPYILDRGATGFTTDLTVVISQQPDGSQPLATTTLAVPVAGESGLISQTYVPTFLTPPNLVKDQAYYLVFSLPAGAGSVSICGSVVVIIQGPVEYIDQTLPAPAECMVREGMAYVNAFVAQENGPLSNLYLNEVTNLTEQTELQPKSLRLSLSLEGQSEPVSVAKLTEPVGTSEGETATGTTMVFDNPAIMEEGRAYRLALAYEAGSAGLTLQGTGIASEGPWDDGLPLRVDNYDPFGGIYPRDVELNMVWEDNPDKLAHMLDVLNKAEVIAISSNRFWGTETRLPERFPLSTLYYRRLLGCPDERDLLWCYYVAKPSTFAGDLGFELVQVYQSDPYVGTLRINDQIAEEAFTVYDHPKVLIFRKTVDYQPEHVAEVLGGVDLSQVIHLTPKTAMPILQR